MKNDRQFKRQIGIGDLHACNPNLLKDLVENQIEFNADEDQLIFLGDYIDRRAYGKQIVSYLQALKKKHPNNIVLLCGNHEDLCLSWMTQQENATVEERLYARQYFPNGGDATLRSFKTIENLRETLIPFIESLELYYETESHIFIHAGLPKGTRDISKADRRAVLWNRDLDYRGDKTLVIGHNIVDRVTKKRNHVLVDTGAFLTGVLSAYDVINDNYYEAVDIKKRRRISRELQLRLL